MKYIKENFFAVTGGPGTGKSTLLQTLMSYGYTCIGESARQIIRERVSKGLPPRPDDDEFGLLMLEQDENNFMSNVKSGEIIFFDRSVVDSAYYLKLRGSGKYEHRISAVDRYRYNGLVFIAPPWEEIFCGDSERDQTFEESVKIYGQLEEAYVSCGYTLAELPKVSAEERAKFVIEIVTSR